jgi:hypothetical protein
MSLHYVSVNNRVCPYFYDVEHPGDGPAKKEQVKQMIKDALPDEQWKIDPEFFDFILDISIDVVVMFLKKGFWKSAMKVLAR